MNDLTVSNIERQNVLNNRYAVDALQENLGFTGMLFEGERVRDALVRPKRE